MTSDDRFDRIIYISSKRYTLPQELVRDALYVPLLFYDSEKSSVAKFNIIDLWSSPRQGCLTSLNACLPLSRDYTISLGAPYVRTVSTCLMEIIGEAQTAPYFRNRGQSLLLALQLCTGLVYILMRCRSMSIGEKGPLRSVQFLLDYLGIQTGRGDLESLCICGLTGHQVSMKQTGSFSRVVEYGFRFVGLWPGLPYAAIKWSLCVLSVLVAQYFFYSYAVLHFDVKNISPLIDCLSLAFGYSLFTLKLANLWVNRRAFHEIVGAIDEDWREASVIATNMSVMLQRAELARLCSNILVAVNAVAVFLYVIGSYIVQSMYSSNDSREFPVRMELPFDISASPIFELALFAQCLHQTTIAMLVGVLDGMVVTLIFHVSGQIDIVCNKLRELTSKSFESPKTVKKLIYQHQKIIDFSNSINNMFSFIALLEFLWNTIVICCIGVAIVASLGTDDAPMMMTKSITFYIAISLEPFVFCCGGEYLSTKSKSIGDAVYDSLWYDLKPHECKVLLFILARSQRHLTVTAGGLMDLSLEAFTSLLKASASYMSVLLAMC